MIYAAYAILCKTPVAWGVLALFVLATFVPNMVRVCGSRRVFIRAFVGASFLVFLCCGQVKSPSEQ